MKPTRAQIKHAVFYAAASLSGRQIADLEEGMILGGTKPKGVGMMANTISGFRKIMDVWIEDRGGTGRLKDGELKAQTTLEGTIEITQGKF